MDCNISSCTKSKKKSASTREYHNKTHAIITHLELFLNLGLIVKPVADQGLEVLHIAQEQAITVNPIVPTPMGMFATTSLRASIRTCSSILSTGWSRGMARSGGGLW
jgi:hypothetical protein